MTDDGVDAQAAGVPLASHLRHEVCDAAATCALIVARASSC
jgi:hypothetical protein